jgi:hypothetical protein
MATLVSPGVSVSVSDESFYAPAGTGSVPLIVIATAQDKSSPDGSGTATYTTSATADKLYRISSQRELLQNYGNPTFKSSGGTQLHGNEQNEYGLLAAYSFLGVANSAYVLRANVDLAALTASTLAPTTAPANGSYWLDTASTVIGVKKYDGSKYARQTVKVPASTDLASDGTPKTGYGTINDFAVVYYGVSGNTLATFKVYQKTTSSAWDLIGSTGWSTRTSSADFQIGDHSNLPVTRAGGGALVSGDIFLQVNAFNDGSVWSLKLYNSATAQFTAQNVESAKLMASAFSSARHGENPELGDIFFDASGEGANEADGTASFKPKRHNGKSSVSFESTAALADTDISLTGHSGKISISLRINSGSNVDVTFSTDGDADGNASVDDMVQDINTALAASNSSLTYANTVIASNNSGKIKIVNSTGTDVLLIDGNVSGFSASNLNLSSATAYSNFEALSFTAKDSAISGTLADGTLWYDSSVSTEKVDVLYNDATTGWEPYTGDVQVKGSSPTLKSDGVSSLVDGDIWVDGSDLENYPVIYKRASNAWVLVDNTDQVSPDGIIFNDFRSSSSSNALISTAVSSSLFPANMLAWNKLLSGGNVKKYDATSGLWLDHSGNKTDGSPYMLRKAQRAVIVKAMQASVVANQDIRNETNRFNIMAVPGYPELADEMINLGTDRKNTVFSIIDSPLRLKSDATSTKNWATNSANASENGEDGLVSSDPYAAVYYPSGLSTNLDGSSVMVPSSHMALRTLAFNDQVAFPWFAPAGFQRGLVNNATSVGYLDPTSSEYVPVSLSEGQRDNLYINKVNPIGNFPGRGLAVFGQKTLNPVSSALDRVNVARLVVYLREQLDDAVKPFLFEPNDEVTRANAKSVVERLLGELVSQRGLFDFITVCDSSNNTPARIDRNELHIDVAIQPVKAVEFIYIPIRIQNTLGQTG